MVSGIKRSVLGLPPRTAVAYAVAFLVAFGAYSVLWRDAPIIQGDSLQYLEVARDLSDFGLDRLHDRAPGYPLLLVLTGSSQGPTRLLFQISLVLHFASIWLLAVVLHSAGVGRWWLLASGGVLLLPSYVEPAAHVMTENLGQFTLVAGFACLMFWILHRRPLALAVSALAFGGSTLTRPVYQALVPAVVGCLFLIPGVLGRVRFSSADVVRTSAALIAGSLLLVGGFSWLNYSKFSYFGVSPLIGFHLSTKTILLAERLPEEYAVVRDILLRERDAELVKRGSTHSGSQTVWEARAELHAATGLSTPELSRYLLRMNLALVRLAPIEYLQEVARSLSTYWFPAAGPLANMRSTAVRWLGTGIHFGFIAVFFLQLTVLAGLAVAGASRRLVGSTEAPLGAIKADATQTMAFVLAGVIVFYTMIVSCLLDIGEPRQRRPTDVLLIFMCVLGAHVWCRTLSASRPTEQSPAAGCDRT